MTHFEPRVTLLVAAYNEREWLDEKVRNALEVDYPSDKLDILFVTDGSTDGSEHLLRMYKRVRVEHEPMRRGKLAAVDRAMRFVRTPIVIFSDANTLINRQAIRNIVRHFAAPDVGGVAGEKRIQRKKADAASGSGEGLYWRYESMLKKMDSALYSVVGAAGELFAVRTSLYHSLPPDTIIEDFVLSMNIARRGFRVVYEADAFALETASASVSEEMKRKARIAAGGFQAMMRLRGLLNPFPHALLTFQYVSHRVLRWAAIPFLLPFVLLLNLGLAATNGGVYNYTALLQLVFYACAALGWILRSTSTRWKALFVPMYFVMMNVAVYRGLARYLTKSQSAVWERAHRDMSPYQKVAA